MLHTRTACSQMPEPQRANSNDGDVARVGRTYISFVTRSASVSALTMPETKYGLDSLGRPRFYGLDLDLLALAADEGERRDGAVVSLDLFNVHAPRHRQIAEEQDFDVWDGDWV